MTLLSIAIPAYNRPDALEYALLRFVSQIVLKYEDEVEIVVTDDKTPGDRLRAVRERMAPYPFVRFIRNPENIGLERNLIHCTEPCIGEYLWLFGDDDFVETPETLDGIMSRLRKGEHDFYILNRTRRSAALDKLISSNWMNLDPEKDEAFGGLREFCVANGFIGVIGFISVNIFRRKPFAAVDVEPYYGTMYPQLGTMAEAFHDRPTLLIGEPLVCHRTQTEEQKRAEHGNKKTEADFMSGDIERRNGLYFSHPLARMLNRLLDVGAFEPSELAGMKEIHAFRGLPLMDLVIASVNQSRVLDGAFTEADWALTNRFFARLPLTAEQKAELAQA